MYVQQMNQNFKQQVRPDNGPHPVPLPLLQPPTTSVEMWAVASAVQWGSWWIR